MPWTAIASIASALFSGFAGNYFAKQRAESSIGTDQKRLDTLYPGTNSWERLGATGGAGMSAGTASGASAGSDQKALQIASRADSTQKRGQDIQLKQTEIQSATALKAAEINAEAPMGRYSLERERQPGHIAQQAGTLQGTYASTRKTMADTQHQKTVTKGVEFENKMKKAKSNLANKFAHGELTELQTRRLNTVAVNIARGVFTEDDFSYLEMNADPETLSLFAALLPAFLGRNLLRKGINKGKKYFKTDKIKKNSSDFFGSVRDMLK